MSASVRKTAEPAGHLLAETEHCPPRFATLGFPDRATLGAIGLGEL